MNKTFDAAEVKTVSEAGELSGYAAVFNNTDMQGDVITPGAFQDSLGSFISDGHLCVDHDWTKRVGYISDAREDARGLFFRAKFLTTKAAREALQECRERFKAGRKIALSIGFNVAEAIPLKNGVRAIKKANLFEVSLVAFGANSLASVTSLKSLSPAEQHLHWLRQEHAKQRRCDEAFNKLFNKFATNMVAEMQAKAKKNG